MVYHIPGRPAFITHSQCSLQLRAAEIFLKRYRGSGATKQSTPVNSINPAVGSDGTFTTTTSTLAQALDTPVVRVELGLNEGADDFTISNVGKASAPAGADHPFLYITAQSSNPQKSTEIVGDVVTVARKN